MITPNCDPCSTRMSIANVGKECGCQVSLKDGKLVGVVNPAPAKQGPPKK